jgi:enoyl-CoA hydratase/carnithine racemase
MNAPIIVERKGAVVWLTLNRPERRNAVSEELYRHLLHALGQAEGDADIRVVVLRGAGRGFCAGADLKTHAAAQRPADERAC